MNVSQKSLTYVGKYAEEIKRIKDTSVFLKDCTALTENEKTKGFWERVISESVMAVKHFENWKKTPKDMCDYLNSNSSIGEYREIESYFSRLIPYTDKIENEEIAKLFTSKNMFIWMMLFDRFNKLHISDNSFGEFLQEFVSDLCYKEINGETWIEIDADKHTKDRSVINKKVNHLEALMNEFLLINKEDLEEVDVLKFVKENVNSETTQEDIEDYREDLERLTCDVDNDTRLLDEYNLPSLLSIIAYTYKEDIIIDEWFVDFFRNNNTYTRNQKENYLNMKASLEDYIKQSEVA